jgi:hypothetical protein
LCGSANKSTAETREGGALAQAATDRVRQASTMRAKTFKLVSGVNTGEPQAALVGHDRVKSCAVLRLRIIA